MTNDQDMEASRKGVLARVSGIMLIILGSMDCMLAWRGGFDINGLYIGLLVSGFILFAIGSIQKHHN